MTTIDLSDRTLGPRDYQFTILVRDPNRLSSASMLGAEVFFALGQAIEAATQGPPGEYEGSLHCAGLPKPVLWIERKEPKP